MRVFCVETSATGSFPTVGMFFSRQPEIMPMQFSANQNASPLSSAESAGRQLRNLRLQSGFTLRAVHSASLQIATQLENRAFIIPPSRLCELETKPIVPSIHRLYTLAQLYHCSLPELMSWYGVPT
jgi:hypothetical protein